MSQRNLRIYEAKTEQKEMSNTTNEYCNRYSSEGSVDNAIRQAGYEHFVQLISQNAPKKNLVLSENGALEYASTGSALVDFNARATEFRNADEEDIIKAATRAYAEDPVKFVKLMFQTGDIRGGKGERHTFNTCMDWLVALHPAVALEVLSLIPEYTRWDYLVRQSISDNKDVSLLATQIVVEQFSKDVQRINQLKDGENADISLLAKWMPSLQTKKASDKRIVRHLLKSLNMQEREYRKALSNLRAYLNIIEKALSAKDYEAIDMEKLTSKQQLRYSSCLKRILADQRHAYIQAVLRGEKKMNTSVLNPLEIVHEYTRGCYKFVQRNEDLEALWQLLPDKISGNNNTLVIRDGSGSMTARIGQGSSATMLEAATAMAIYCAQRLSGAFKDKFITFSSCPQIVDITNCHTLADAINLMLTHTDCSNTDLEATFDLVLEIAVINKLSQDEIPSYLLILSDMEFDMARSYDGLSREALFTTIRKKWDKAGYEMPALVFWQLNGKRTIYPEIDAKNGIIFLSGFATSELTRVMAGEYETIEEVEVIDENTGETTKKKEKKILSPMQQLEVKLSDPRYDAVEEAALKGLSKESA